MFKEGVLDFTSLLIRLLKIFREIPFFLQRVRHVEIVGISFCHIFVTLQIDYNESVYPFSPGRTVTSVKVLPNTIPINTFAIPSKASPNHSGYVGSSTGS